eukprot:CAMPEP_0118937586 /NCGR_PEP_ID=MMETSP1169-20130426/23197_1 /TAXON_ID=36882 /ORGANISM="Pyramimonas obovata, Strain CCMP722" /LENGTH=121 /DNA_ID=CAMNT_0006881263 /DNA_START=12 /DNA_END=377 /DNA_ORIENTATION=+
MEVDEVLEDTIAAAESKKEETKDQVDEAEEEMADEPAEGEHLSAKERKRREMEAKRLLKVQVSQLKQTSKKLKKKDYLQKAERRGLDRHVRELVKDTKEAVRQKEAERQEKLQALPGAKIH